MGTPEYNRAYYARTKEKQLADAKQRHDNDEYKKEKAEYDEKYYRSNYDERKCIVFSMLKRSMNNRGYTE